MGILTTSIGPFPLGLWLVIVAGIVGDIFIIRKAENTMRKLSVLILIALIAVVTGYLGVVYGRWKALADFLGLTSIINTMVDLLPPAYWIMLIAVAAFVIFLMIKTGNWELKGGIKRVPDGPLGDAKFASEAELNSEYPTIEYDFNKWCDIGRERERAMREFDIQTEQMHLTSDADKKVREERRDQLYRAKSKGLPMAPGILLGDWHEDDHGKKKVPPVNVVGQNYMKRVKGSDKTDNPIRQGNKVYPRYPWYIAFKAKKQIDPITGKAETVYQPKSIEGDKNFKDNWKGGHVKTRLCTDDIHTMLVASSGAGKSAFFLYPQTMYAMATGQSFVVTDTKGDNVQRLASIARDCFGYKTLSLDLRNPLKSCRFNILHMVNKYTDLWKACPDKTSPEAIEYATKRETYAKTVAQTIVKGSQVDFGSNAFFYDSAMGLIQACVLLVSMYAKPEERHIVSVYSLVQAMTGTEGEGENAETGINVMLDELSPNDKTRFFAGPAAQKSGDAQASVMATAMSKMLDFLDSSMEAILCGDSEIDAEQFCNEKTILFITMPEEFQTRYFLVSLVIQELYNEMLTIASKPENGNKVPAPKGFLGNSPKVSFFLDEFGTLPAITGFNGMMSAARSRNIFFNIILQSTSQLERNYGKDAAKIIMDNCKYTFFTGISPTSEDAEKFSKQMGNFTIEVNSVSTNAKPNGGGASKGRSLQMQARPLKTAEEIKNMPKGDFIIMRTADAGNTANPIQCHFDIFMDWGITLAHGKEEPDRPMPVVSYATKEEIVDSIRNARANEPLQESDVVDITFTDVLARLKKEKAKAEKTN